MPLFDHFGLIAPLYETFTRPREPVELLRWMELPSHGRVLDAAGGTGRIAQALRGKTGQVVVVDLSMGMLRQAREKTGLDLACAPVERLPFSDASFERILMVDALHHVANHAVTIDELWRVLKPGGRIVIEEFDVRNILVKLVALGEKLALMRSHFLSPARIAALFPASAAPVRVVAEGHRAYIIAQK